jgi:2-keto-4-pentenoate hydratase/2-oxohepta-3-ene-1,7-dioic acid hydratase in catechol pathway
MTTRTLSKREEERAHSSSLTDSRMRQNLVRGRKQYLEAELSAVIEGHPEGITLAEAAEGLGVTPVVLAWTTRNLLKRDKIRKKGMHYFPARAE